MAPTEYQVHEACIEVARTITVYKVGVIHIGIVLWFLDSLLAKIQCIVGASLS